MKVLILANNDVGLYKFRKELISELLHPGSFLKNRVAEPCEVFISLPNGDFVSELVDMGCKFIDTPLERHGTNPIAELKLTNRYKQIIRDVRPDVVFSYTIKPNIYGGMACASLNVPYIANITGLGTAIENGGLMQKFLLLLYKYGLRKAQMVFFQNESNRNFMVSRGVIKSSHILLPGSGVNLEENVAETYPDQEKPIVFVSIGRIMKDKGADEVLYAAKMIRKEFPNVTFRLIGGFDGAYEERVNEAVDDGDIEYLGQQSDVHTFLKGAHAIVHASYHEGMSNVLLEAAACARPIVATDVHGCREIYENGVSGIPCKARDGNDLVRAIRDFIVLPYGEKKAMGIAGRQKVEREFDRNIVIRKYLVEIEKVK